MSSCADQGSSRSGSSSGKVPCESGPPTGSGDDVPSSGSSSTEAALERNNYLDNDDGGDMIEAANNISNVSGKYRHISRFKDVKKHERHSRLRHRHVGFHDAPDGEIIGDGVTPLPSQQQQQQRGDNCYNDSGNDNNRTLDQQPPPPPPPPTSVAAPTVGLINEGCTCYLNSLLQLLFHLTFFRSAVYRIPVEDESTSIYKALQEIFFQMQERTTPARTGKLTDAFGWSESELFVQHDIQEMATLLRDNLEQRMKGTVAEGTIHQLFEGCGVQFVETLDKSYISRTKDVFYDIHLPLEGHSTLMQSLRSLTTRDKLTGDNKYRVEREGQPAVYMDAEKGYAFRRFPPVTWFHLKRFAMDLTSPTLEMKKVNTCLEFPAVLDLRELEAEGEASAGPADDNKDDAGKDKSGERAPAPCFTTDSPAIYDLQGVIVHRGTVSSGHYYCYIREWDPAAGAFTRWIEYDDDSVRPVSEQAAIRANYGQPPGMRFGGVSASAASAYILSYVRRADAPVLLAPSPTNIITQRVKDALRQAMLEEEEQLRAERELRQSLTLCIVTDTVLREYCRANQMELFARDARSAKLFAALVVKVNKADPLRTIYERIAAEPCLAQQGVRVGNCRLWRWSLVGMAHPSSALLPYHSCVEGDFSFAAILQPSELERPVTITLYLQPESPPFVLRHPGALVAPTLSGLRYDEAQDAWVASLRVPIYCLGLYLLLDQSAVAVYACKVVVAALTTDVEANRNNAPPRTTHRLSVNNGVVCVPLDGNLATVEVRFRVTSNDRNVPMAAVHFVPNVPRMHPLMPGLLPRTPPPPVTPPGAGSLTGSFNASFARQQSSSLAAATVEPSVPLQPENDRVLLFFKYYEPATSALRYLGSALVDAMVTPRSLEPLVFGFCGLVYPREEEPNYLGLLTFFEETRGGNVVELSPLTDLFENKLRHGAVLIAQPREVPPLYQYPSVDGYLQTLTSLVDVQVLEVVLDTRDNVRETQAALREARAQWDAVAEQHQRRLDAGEFAYMDGKREAPSVAADTRENPWATTLPAQGQVVMRTALSEGEAPPGARAPLPSVLCCMSSLWDLDAITAAIAEKVGGGASAAYLRLYANASGGTTTPTPSAQPIPSSRPTTLEEIINADHANPSTALFYERLRVPRAKLDGAVALTVTVRDAAGHAVHRVHYTPKERELSWAALAQGVLALVRPWQLEAAHDVWGTLAATVASPCFVLLVLDHSRHRIRAMREVDMTGASADTQQTLDPALATHELELVAAPPLQPGQLRVACCHGHYHSTDTANLTFGQPFFVTAEATTTVAQAVDLALAAAAVPFAALSNERRLGAMMLTHAPLELPDWGLPVRDYWAHTVNHSRMDPSLMLNHPAPREKPGSRYVAQYNPKLTIAKQ